MKKHYLPLIWLSTTLFTFSAMAACPKPGPVIAHAFELIKYDNAVELKSYLEENPMIKGVTNEECETFYLAGIRSRSEKALTVLESTKFGVTTAEEINSQIPKFAINTYEFAVAYSSMSIIKKLESRGAKRSERLIADKKTLLMIASASNSLNVIKELIANGEDIHAKDVTSFHAFNYAVTRNNNLSVIDFYLANGADLHERISGKTPLLQAASFNQIHIIKRLVKHGADLSDLDNFSSNALMLAAGYNSVEVVKFFISTGLDINATDRPGSTALMYSISNKNGVGALKTILESGADIDLVDISKRSALHHACLMLGWGVGYKERAREVIQLLLKAGANKTLLDKDNQSPYNLARKTLESNDPLSKLLSY